MQYFACTSYQTTIPARTTNILVNQFQFDLNEIDQTCWNKIWLIFEITWRCLVYTREVNIGSGNCQFPRHGMVYLMTWCKGKMMWEFFKMWYWILSWITYNIGRWKSALLSLLSKSVSTITVITRHLMHWSSWNFYSAYI